MKQTLHRGQHAWPQTPAQPPSRTRRTWLFSALVPLALAVLATGCDSQLHMTGTPQLAPATAVRASATASASGRVISIDDPSVLPQAVREAKDLKVGFGSTRVAVTKLANGSFTFVIPASATVPQDVSGNLQIIFIINDTVGQQITLFTGSPVQFANPPVITEPASGTVALGLDTYLNANTQGDTSNFDFTWSASTSATGPFTTIPGTGKRVKWTPTVAGNYFVKVDAVNKTNQQSYSTITPSAVVFVTQPKDIITTEPTSGAIARGNSVTIKFNTPAGFTGTNLSYAWSYGTSANGPWTTITGGDSTVSFLPTDVGSYFVKVDVSNKDTGAVNTFVSPQAVVFVSESKPIVTASNPLAHRGDQVSLTLNVPNAGAGPFAWYYSRSSASTTAGAAASGAYLPLVGTGSTITTVATDIGSYNFRVDIPQPDGSVKTFVTTSPVLNVTEPSPIVHTDPPFTSVAIGGSAKLVLDATGVDEANYHFLWFVSTNPAAGFTSLPFDTSNSQTAKNYQISSTTSSRFAAGSYYVRVDAVANDGSKTYSFVSTQPALTVTNLAIR